MIESKNNYAESEVVEPERGVVRSRPQQDD
jgi:hypothetical protein